MNAQPGQSRSLQGQLPAGYRTGQLEEEEEVTTGNLSQGGRMGVFVMPQGICYIGRNKNCEKAF
jgi:hypothetical protein